MWLPPCLGFGDGLKWDLGIIHKPGCRRRQFFALQEGQDTALISVGPSLLNSEQGLGLRIVLPKRRPKPRALRRGHRHGGVDKVLASICDHISPASPTLAATPKMITTKIQVNLRPSLSQKVRGLVGFLPGLAEGLPVCPSPGIISSRVASLGLSRCFVP